MSPGDMITSAADLLGRCRVATERKLSASPTPLLTISQLGLPSPCDATNAELDMLKPVYQNVLKNFDTYLQVLLYDDTY
jgi:hypothetical protein